MIKGILFDKDGTLLDFNGSWLAPYLQASEYLANSVGKPELAAELMEKGGYIAKTNSWISDSLLASGSNRQILDFWAEQIGESLEGERLDMIYAIFSRASEGYVPVIKDLREFLEQLKGRGIRLGVATMDDETNAHKMIEKLDLAGLFDFICGANSGFGVKPEPGMVLGFCDQCGLHPSNVMMVGDSPRDLQMGRNASAGLSVGVLTGAHNKTQLESHGDHVLENVSGILELLGQD